MRGCLRKFGDRWTRGESPSPGSHLTMRSDLSPQAGRGEESSAAGIKLTHGHCSALLVAGAQTELSCPGISFPEGDGLRRLLFLNGIKAFEAAARSGSFAAAGAELNVSAAAVSRMVHLLEERLGVALFERKANRLSPTPAGRAYQSGLTPIFDALASLTAQVTAPSSVRVLTVGVGPTFAMRWLIPRLADFRKEAPDIDVRITTGGAAAPFGDDWSCGVRLGDGDWPGLIAEPLFAADLLPVCAPRLAARLKRPSDLKGPSLLRVAHSPDDWPLWLKAAGCRDHRARAGVSVLRPGAAGGGRRARHRHGHPSLYRRRPRRGAAGRAVCAQRAQGHALVPGLSRFSHRAARLCRLPPLDHPRGGRARRAPQEWPQCRLSKSKPS